jgi:hypothetical protein
MPQLFRTKLWQLEFPDKWSVRAGQNYQHVTFWNPEGVGQLTVLTTDGNKAPPRDGPHTDFHGRIHGKSHEHSGSQLFARHWTLMCGEQWIYVRYSCAAKNADLERTEVDRILQTISESV